MSILNANYSYEYNIKDAASLSFELCATFNKEGSDMYASPNSMVDPLPPYPKQNWDHTLGRVCFERKIDKELYPPLDKTKY